MTDGVIEGEARCIGCGYWLRGLKEDGQCPECGASIEWSLSEGPLSESDPAWVANMARGAALVMWAAVILMVAACLAALPPRRLGEQMASVLAGLTKWPQVLLGFSATAMVSTSGMLLGLGLWWLGCPEPTRPSASNLPRHCLRGFGLLIVIWAVARCWMRLGVRTTEIWVVDAVLWVPTGTLLTLALNGVWRRLPQPTTERWRTIAAGLATVTAMELGAVVGSRSHMSFAFATPAQGLDGSVFVVALACAGVMTFAMFFDVARRLKQAAIQANERETSDNGSNAAARPGWRYLAAGAGAMYVASGCAMAACSLLLPLIILNIEGDQRYSRIPRALLSVWAVVVVPLLIMLGWRGSSRKMDALWWIGAFARLWILLLLAAWSVWFEIVPCGDNGSHKGTIAPYLLPAAGIEGFVIHVLRYLDNWGVALRWELGIVWGLSLATVCWQSLLARQLRASTLLAGNAVLAFLLVAAGVGVAFEASWPLILFFAIGGLEVVICGRTAVLATRRVA